MAHSKRNTSLAFFTTHERSLLKNTWGSQSTRLTRDSFLPFASCNLCLQPSRAPVACASDGDIFCRECIVSNLLAQKQEMQRLEAGDRRRRREGEEEARGRMDEERERSVREFERTMMGLEGDHQHRRNGSVTANTSIDKKEKEKEKAGVKRKFELDETDIQDNAKADRAKARKAIDLENASKPTLPSFWVPALTPSTKPQSSASSAKLSPICPASAPSAPHPLSLKSLISISFSTSTSSTQNTTTTTSTSSDGTAIICPACTKPLTNASKAVVAVRCGHVLCKACAGKFMTGPSSPPPPAGEGEEDHVSEGRCCYVCSTPLFLLPADKQRDGHGRRKKMKKGGGGGGNGAGDAGGGDAGGGKLNINAERIAGTGTVELRSEGTGFAGGGRNTARREGVAFQC